MVVFLNQQCSASPVRRLNVPRRLVFGRDSLEHDSREIRGVSLESFEDDLIVAPSTNQRFVVDNSWEVMTPSLQQQLSASDMDYLRLNNAVKQDANGRWLMVDSVEDGFIPWNRLPASTVDRSSVGNLEGRLRDASDEWDLNDSREEQRRWESILSRAVVQ